MKTLLEGKIEDKIVAVDWFAKRYLFTILDKSHKLHVYQDSALFKERNDHDGMYCYCRLVKIMILKRNLKTTFV